MVLEKLVGEKFMIPCKNIHPWKLILHLIFDGPNLHCFQFFGATRSKYLEVKGKIDCFNSTLIKNCRNITPIGPPMRQAEADTELTLSALAATAVGQILLTMAKFC